MRRAAAAAMLVFATATACSYQSAPLCGHDDCLKPAPDAGLCTRDPDCPLGALCIVGRCTAGCRSSRDCAAGQTCDPQRGPYGTCLGGPDAAVPRPDAPVVVTPDATGSKPDATVIVDAHAPPDTAALPDAACTQTSVPLLLNGDFEQGHTSWSESPAQGEELVVVYGDGGLLPHGGTYLLWLGGILSSKESVSQNVTIPDGTTSLTLRGYYRITTAEPSGGAGVDKATFEFPFALSGIFPLVLGTMSNRDAVGAWTPFTMSADLQGAPRVFSISFSNDSSAASNLYLDDLVLTATVCR